MDKAKALLVLYSNRFLDGELDVRINEIFGTCFAAYDRVREQAAQIGYKIDLIDRVNFSEDDLLRYHYLAYDAIEANDYYGYSQTILDLFLKPALKARQTDAAALRTFISDYIQDLEGFAQAFSGIVNQTRYDTRLFTLLVVHGLAARLYPITIRLYQRGLLFQTGSTIDPAIDMLHCIEAVDFRVYKIRGTDPARDIGHLSHTSRTAAVTHVATRLRAFVIDFMPDGLMQTHLGGKMYKSAAVIPILLAFEQKAMGQTYGLPQLVELVVRGPSQEHILSQEPSFDHAVRGFESQTDFDECLDKIGNLTLLTNSENARCRNKAAELKMSQPDLYLSSKFAGPRLLAQEFSVSGTPFDKSAVLTRIKLLIEFALAAIIHQPGSMPC